MDIESVSTDSQNIEIEYETLTMAETEQRIIQKRDKLYVASLRVAIVFMILSAALMVCFKINEGFFDANSRIGLLMESVNEREENLLYPKINVRANFRDEKKSKLVIPLTATLTKENVSIREEFIQKKIVVTLTGYSENMADGVELVSDSSIMDAVGIYRQNNDVVVEIYCRDIYDYELVADNNTLTVHFNDISDDYNAVVVVWLPYEDRNRLALPEWKQSIEKFSRENKIKLYMAPDMFEEYTQTQIIEFANRIKADMVLGVRIQASDAQQAYMEAICNTAYFVPFYNSTQLAIAMAETFAETTQIKFTEFKEPNEKDALVSQASVASAIINIMLPQNYMESVENTYELGEKIVKSLENTISGVVDIYIDKEKEKNEK